MLGRQNCLEKELLLLRSQVSMCGRPKDFYTVAPRNIYLKATGKALLHACAEDEDHWKLRDSCCPLGLAPIPTLSCTSATAGLRLCPQVQGLSLSDGQKQHWSLVCAFGNSLQVFSNHYQWTNCTQRSTLPSSPISHTITRGKVFQLSTKANRRLGLFSRHTCPSATSRTGSQAQHEQL